MNPYNPFVIMNELKLNILFNKNNKIENRKQLKIKNN